MDIKYEPIKTHDDEGNRFVLTIDERDNSTWLYDNHKRDGYGIYAGDNSRFSDGKINKENMRYLTGKLNELYNENQALKNHDNYHQFVMSKLDKLIDEFHFYVDRSFERYHESKSDNDRLTFFSYLDVVNSLEYVKEELQCEEYG